MTVDELDEAGNWSNEEYFDYMKETGQWDSFEKLEHADKPCDRCEQTVRTTWKVESYLDVADEDTEPYTVVTEFEICTLCMFELYGSKHPVGQK